MPERFPGGETDLIRRFFAPLAKHTPGAFGLQDDAGSIRPPGGQELVLTTDMLVAGVHFLDIAAPHDVAWKALAVNVSDLCAKGARPDVYLLSIALPPDPDPDWLQALCDGFAEAQSAFGCGLLGGDTVSTPGPVTISITAAGYVPAGQMVHRAGAREGDDVYVTGTIGDAALGLRHLQQKDEENRLKLLNKDVNYLHRRYWRPQLRLEAITIVRGFASAAMDVSDGLAGDFAKLCVASGAGGIIHAGDVPLSRAAAAWVKQDPDRMNDILSGGDDYEILLAVPGDRRKEFDRACKKSGLQFTRIGRIAARSEGICIVSPGGKAIALERGGFDHFRPVR